MPKKVLLIEYEPRYIERIRTLLTPLGHALTEAHDGEAGLQAFGTSKFDVVLLSGMLPRLPSAEVIREIRKKGGATAPPILLMMSGYRGTNRKADAQKVGAFDILARPFNDEDLVGSVKDALESSDIGAKTMRIDTSQLAAAGTPLTSNDIFSDVLSDLKEDAGSPLVDDVRSVLGRESHVLGGERIDGRRPDPGGRQRVGVRHVLLPVEDGGVVEAERRQEEVEHLRVRRRKVDVAAPDPVVGVIARVLDHPGRGGSWTITKSYSPSSASAFIAL